MIEKLWGMTAFEIVINLYTDKYPKVTMDLCLMFY